MVLPDASAKDQGGYRTCDFLNALIGGVKLPYSNNRGIRIYYEVEGSGPPLVLMHGLTLNRDMWRLASYVESLKEDYRLVLIDARGHGASDKPHDPSAYRMSLRVGDVISVLDDLGISRAHYFGYSEGGWIGYGIVKSAPERFHSLAIGGQSPKKEPSATLSSIKFFEQGLGVLVDSYEKGFGTSWTAQWEAIASANDPEALVALLSCELEENSFEDILPHATIPCLLLVGEADDEYPGVNEGVKRMPGAMLVSLPGFGHDVVFRSDVIVPHIRQFLASPGIP